MTKWSTLFTGMITLYICSPFWPTPHTPLIDMIEVLKGV